VVKFISKEFVTIPVRTCDEEGFFSSWLQELSLMWHKSNYGLNLNH